MLSHRHARRLIGWGELVKIRGLELRDRMHLRVVGEAATELAGAHRRHTLGSGQETNIPPGSIYRPFFFSVFERINRRRRHSLLTRFSSLVSFRLILGVFL